MGNCNKCGKGLEPDTEIAQWTTMQLDKNGDAIESTVDYGSLYCMECHQDIEKAFI